MMTEKEIKSEMQQFADFTKDMEATKQKIIDYDRKINFGGNSLWGLRLYCKHIWSSRFQRENIFHYEIRSIFGVIEVLKFIKRWQGICLSADSLYEFRLNGRRIDIKI